ncbi:MAG: acyl-CoA synthetase [Proteobacteria bacterium]|nr:acyl-CoA synthetase [Pseudomonadota bacterium]
MTLSRLASLLLDGAAERPIASVDDQTVNLEQFRADVASAISQIEEAQCRRGLVVCDDAYWAMVGMFALAHAGAETVFPPNALPSTAAALSGAFDHILTDGAQQGGSIQLNSGIRRTSPILPANADAARINLFTSGSSGTPKRVVKTLRQLELEAEVVDRVLGKIVPECARVHATVAHQHLYGLTFRLCWPLATGRPFFNRPHQFWEPLLASVKHGDVLVTTPSHLSRLGALPSLPSDRRPSAVLSGGAPLPDAAATSARVLLGCPVREFVGSTEAGVIASRLHVDVEAPSWQPLPGVTVTRLDDGRMRVRSPYILNAEDELGGDFIEFDGAGGFRLLGRADRIAKIEGVRVSLSEFDSRMAELSGVARAAVVLLPGDIPHLGGVVMLDADGEKELAESGAFWLGRRLRRDLARCLPEAALPRRWRFVKQLPAGLLGKVSAADLAALFDVSNGTGEQAE